MPKPQPCTEHTRRYAAGCPGCQAYRRTLLARRRRLIAFGRWAPPVPAEQVQPHLLDLLNHMTVSQVAARTGVSRPAVNAIKLGQRKYVDPDNAAAILGLPVPASTAPAAPPPAGCVPAVGCRRMTRALAAVGHSTVTIAADSGVPRKTVRDLRNGARVWVTARVAERIAVTYARLADTRGKSHEAEQSAREQGWHPPIAWDDDTINDPAICPAVGHLLADTPADVPPLVAAYVAAAANVDQYDDAHVWAALAGRRPWALLTAPEKDAVCRRLADAGCNHADIAARVHSKTETVAKHCQRRGIASAVPHGRAA